MDVDESQPIEDLPWFRAVVVAALVATVVITGPLWNVRVVPPLLPAIGFPEVSLGVPLLFASAAALVRPRVGAVAVTIIIAYGMATDQTRMQPELFSLPLLLWGSLSIPAARLIVRVHLVTLWFYSGMHKLLSPQFLADGGPRMMQALPWPVPERVAMAAAVAIPLIEIGTAVLAIAPATRRAAAWAALVLHGGIVVSLVTLAETPNTAVWPWNIALATSGFALIAPWTTTLLSDFLAVSVVPRMATVLLVMAPLGFYLGVVDAYPAHQLYTWGTARATVYCPQGCRPEQDVNATWYELNVPLPPQPRLFLASFAKTCQPGDVLRIDDPHPPPWSGRHGATIYSCPAGTLPASHL